MSELAEQAKAIIELQLEAAIEKHLDAGMELLFTEVKKQTPELVDMAIDAMKGKAKELLKQELLKLVEQISDKV